ncbi:MAG: DUF1501 domain-containing protein [Planctomycetaceae bacterium]|jgi:hypothetical protein|nr:DUF1501 domain-containing protein [Planctomycetaceae bacterium]MBT6487380.1 DUF1501 domain-containing protein [Planctomycetaceae bacterium]MBT6496885.1 DUF1501 domain-containing protein [Planctomycetaceae bacterium]
MSETRPNNRSRNNFCGRTRREFLWQTGGGFTGVAMAGLMGNDGFLASQAVAADGVTPFENPLAPKDPHFVPKAKNVIFLFMYGGPSHIDTFDYKPRMKGMDGKTVEVKTFGRGGRRNNGRIVETPWKFNQYGQCGQWVSDLFPNLATCVDDIAFLHSMTADSPIHGSAMLMMNSGRILSGSPCLGSWLNYGLGSENEDLPGFVVMLDPRGGPISGAKNWSSGYMPADFQATVMRSQGEPILNLQRPNGLTEGMQRHLLDTLRDYNKDHQQPRADNSNLAARIASYELAFKMQTAAPEATDLSSETEATQELYGLGEKRSEPFGRQCLLARRLVERGVRFVQIYSGGNHNDANWDAHGDLKHNHDMHAGETDKPIAGLIKDLKQRGMLKDTLIVWGGEFGRQPTAEYARGTGRDHNSFGFTMWMAGGGIKGGVSVGKTDELGSTAVEDRMHVKRLHATILHQMGMDPDRLSYFYGGLDQKLVGVEGAEPIRQII